MSLTVGRGPLSDDRAGSLNFEPPAHVVFSEPLGRRVRAVRHGQTVIDSDDAKLVHETGQLPRYAFPAKHVDLDGEPAQGLDDHVVVAWDAADAWFEEDERVLVHPRDPYHRVDTFATSRRIDVRLRGMPLASSTRATALYETGLPVRYYLPRADVRMDLLQPSATVTECPYKGTARHWSAVIEGEVVEDIAWSYEHDIRREGEAVRDLVCFYDTKAEIDVDADRAA